MGALETRDALSEPLGRDDDTHRGGVERRRDGYRVAFADDVIDVGLVDAARGTTPASPGGGGGGPARVDAPMPGKLISVMVSPGDEVDAGTDPTVPDQSSENPDCTADTCGDDALDGDTCADDGSCLPPDEAHSLYCEMEGCCCASAPGQGYGTGSLFLLLGMLGLIARRRVSRR